MSVYLLVIIGLAIGVGVGFFIGKSMMKKTLADHEEEGNKKAQEIIRIAQSNAENIKKDKMLEAKEHFLKLKSEFEDDANQKKNTK
mgnify:FL=1